MAAPDTPNSIPYQGVITDVPYQILGATANDTAVVFIGGTIALWQFTNTGYTTLATETVSDVIGFDSCNGTVVFLVSTGVTNLGRAYVVKSGTPWDLRKFDFNYNENGGLIVKISGDTQEVVIHNTAYDVYPGPVRVPGEVAGFPTDFTDGDLLSPTWSYSDSSSSNTTIRLIAAPRISRSILQYRDEAAFDGSLLLYDSSGSVLDTTYFWFEQYGLEDWYTTDLNTTTYIYTGPGAMPG